MTQHCEVVITGAGVVTPCGIGVEDFWRTLLAGQSGIGPLQVAAGTDFPVRIGGEVKGFDASGSITPRKRLKLMCREIQMGCVAARLAVEHAGLGGSAVQPERFGVVFGAERYHDPIENVEEASRACMVDGKMKPQLWGEASTTKLNPLSMLRTLPNMCACHIAIGLDARGPCNTIVADDVSSLLAIMEGAWLIQRGAVDAVLAGGSGSRINRTVLLKFGSDGLSRQTTVPVVAPRPFDARRDGTVPGEGAGAIVLENREHARRRQARVFARLIACHSGFHRRPDADGNFAAGIARSISQVLKQGDLGADDIGHVNANASGLLDADRVEAQAIRSCLGKIPVTAPKSYFGRLGAGGGAVELAASVMALRDRVIPPTLHYRHPDPQCPVNVIRDEPVRAVQGAAVVLNQTTFGQTASVLLASNGE
jgi:3-oxoacyl-[acyl-carrier-protein] synthase II